MATKTEASVPADSKRNLHQRLAAIAREVKVQATGTTGRQAGNQRAISIGDVDEALGPLFVKHGVVSDYEYVDEPKSFKAPTRDGEMTMWQVGITAYIWNADDSQEHLSRKLYDIGSNPSAAVSFALKRWYRALFKLVEDDDDAPRVAPPPRPASAPVGTDGSNGSGSDDVIPKTLQDLAYSLPKPWFSKKLTAKFAALGPDGTLNELLDEHKTQCGAECTHDGTH